MSASRRRAEFGGGELDQDCREDAASLVDIFIYFCGSEWVFFLCFFCSFFSLFFSLFPFFSLFSLFSLFFLYFLYFLYFFFPIFILFFFFYNHIIPLLPFLLPSILLPFSPDPHTIIQTLICHVPQSDMIQISVCVSGQ